MSRFLIISILLGCINYTYSQPEGVALSIQTGHIGTVNEISFNQSGSMLASAGNDGKVLLWDVKSGKQIRSLVVDRSSVLSLSFSVDDRFLAISTENGKIHIWDVNRGKLDTSFIDFDSAVHGVKYSPDGNFLVSAGKYVRIYDCKNWSYKMLDISSVHSFTHLTMHNRDNVIAFGGLKELWVYAYSIDSNLISIRQFSPSMAAHLGTSVDELYYATNYGKFYVWNESQRMKHGNTNNQILNTYNALEVDSNRLFTGDNHGLIRQYNKESLKVNQRYSGHTAGITSLSASPDGNMLASADKAGYIVLWDIETARIMHALKGQRDPITYAKFNTRQELLIGYDNGVFRLWDFRSNEIITSAYQPSTIQQVLGWSNSILKMTEINDSTIEIDGYKRKVSTENPSQFSEIIPFKLHWHHSKNSFKVMPPANEQKDPIDRYFKHIRKGDKVDNDFFLNQDNLNLSNKQSQSQMAHIRLFNKAIKSHQDKITSLDYDDTLGIIVSASLDGVVNIYSIRDTSLIAGCVAYGVNDFVIYNPSSYYYASKGALKNIAFRYKNKAYDFDQFDIQYNRPDIVFKTFPFASAELIEDYEAAYQKRIDKLSVQDISQIKSVNVPKLSLQLPEQLSVDSGRFEFSSTASSNVNELSRLYLNINGVPEYGRDGRPISGKLHTINHRINLSYGKNLVELFAMDDKGVISYKETFSVFNTEKKRRPKLYLVSIGVSKFTQSAFDLQYAAKDASDINKFFWIHKDYRRIERLKLLDEQVTRERLDTISSFIMNAGINDVVVFYVASHGVLNSELEYYFATHDMNFDKPEEKGIQYAYFENILDACKSRNKLMLIDACHSGEIDKSSVITISDAKKGEGELQFRRAGISIVSKELDGIHAFELSKKLFADTRHSNGSTVISSSGGGEYAVEGEEWSNGIFTYYILQGLKSEDADLNGDKSVSVFELHRYLELKVHRATDGNQRPNARTQNLHNNFILW